MTPPADLRDPILAGMKNPAEAGFFLIRSAG